MNISKVLTIAVLPVFFLFANTNNSFALAKEKVISIKTEFHCNGGKSKIESEIAKLEGVNSVVADLETKIVTIKYDPAKQDKKKLVAAIEQTGHKTEFTKKSKEVKSDCSSKGHDEKKCHETK